MGLGAPSEYWAPVQQEIAGLTRVCRFDRAGRGKSDPAPTTPRTCADMVADLRALLHNAGIPAPYVLVGNSLGGMNARLYAYEHPEEVAGLVLVDGSHQEQFARIRSEEHTSELQSRQYLVCRLLLEKKTIVN